MVFLNHKKKYDNFCENSHFLEIHGQNWGVRRGRNWFEKTKFFLFFETSSMFTILPLVSLAYNYYLKSYGMWMLKLLKRHHLFCFFQSIPPFFSVEIWGQKKYRWIILHFWVYYIYLYIHFTKIYLESIFILQYVISILFYK